MSIRLQNIGKHFGSGRQRTQALEPVNLDIHDGELIGLLGPSGSGKTTLLRIIAGLEHADRDSGARILFGDRDVTQVHVRDRRIGFVFQHYALFRHMTVFDNVAFGLTVMPRRNRPTAGEIRARVHRLLEMLQLDLGLAAITGLLMAICALAATFALFAGRNRRLEIDAEGRLVTR